MFTVDGRTEQFLKHNGVKFEYYDSIQYSELQPSWRDNNLGRREPIDEEAVFEYALRMEGGSAAPAVIVIKQNDGYAALDGVQRLRAGEDIKATAFAAYVVDRKTSVAKQHLIRICANAGINGQNTPDKNFLLATAVEVMYYGDGCSAEEISRGVGRSVKAVQEEIRFQRTVQNMASTGYEGKLTRRTKKWFPAMIGKYADQSDWSAAHGPIKEWLMTYEKCGFKNGDSEPLVEQFWDVDRSAKKDRNGQFQRNLRDFKVNPEVVSRIGTGKRRMALDDILPSMRRTNTILERAIEREEVIHDGDFANQLAECLRLVIVNCKKLVPRDLQYVGDRRSSIFDKG